MSGRSDPLDVTTDPRYAPEPCPYCEAEDRLAPPRIPVMAWVLGAALVGLALVAGVVWTLR